MLDLLFAPLTWIAESSLGVMTVVLFLLLLATMEACFRASRHATRDASASESLRTATGIVTAAMLGLFAFLLGVMFSLAADRYETRRQGVLEEANAIGTASPPRKPPPSAPICAPTSRCASKPRAASPPTPTTAASRLPPTGCKPKSGPSPPASPRARQTRSAPASSPR